MQASGSGIFDGRLAPIPGMVFLDSDGTFRTVVRLTDPDARDALLRTLEELGKQ